MLLEGAVIAAGCNPRNQWPMVGIGSCPQRAQGDDWVRPGMHRRPADPLREPFVVQRAGSGRRVSPISEDPRFKGVLEKAAHYG